jgi:hypothetical protein
MKSNPDIPPYTDDHFPPIRISRHSVFIIPKTHDVFSEAIVMMRTLDSHERRHCFARGFHVYPAEPIQPWISLSPHTTGEVDSAILQSHSKMIVALSALAIQLFEYVCLTGSHGAVIHWTCLSAQIGAYCMVHIVGDDAETVSRANPDTVNAKIR